MTDNFPLIALISWPLALLALACARQLIGGCWAFGSPTLARLRSRSAYQGRSSRLRFSEKNVFHAFFSCESRGSTAAVSPK